MVSATHDTDNVVMMDVDVSAGVNTDGGNGAFASLHSTDVAVQLDALRSLKTQVIGHVERKREVIQAGVVSRLLSICDDPMSDDGARLESTIVLAALCQGEADLLRELGLISGLSMIDVLGRLVSRSELHSPLRMPAMRALVPIVKSLDEAQVLWRYMFQGSWCLDLLTMALKTPTPAILQQVVPLAQLCSTFHDDIDTEEEYGPAFNIFTKLTVIVVTLTQRGRHRNGLTQMHARLVESCLHALGTLFKTNDALAENIVDVLREMCHCENAEECPTVETLLLLVRSDTPAIRLEAAFTLASLSSIGLIPEMYRKDIALVVLPVVIRLFDEPSLASRAPFVLSDLIVNSDEMQMAACEAGAIKRFATILSTESGPEADGTRESALLAIGAIALSKDEYRKQVVEAKCVPLIVAAMSSPSGKVRSAACRCARSLSRSVTMLKTSLVDGGMGSAVLNLLKDSDPEVQTEACAVLCNLVLEFSPVRRQIIDQGVLSLLATLVDSSHPDLRVNALWAFKHIVYAADATVKGQVLDALGPARLVALCKDTFWPVAEQASEIVRNLGCGKPENVDVLVKAVGVVALVELLSHNLASDVYELVVPAVYSLVNIAAGSELHRQAIVMDQPNILQAIYGHLSHRSQEVRLGAIWAVINLTWLEDDASGAERRRWVETLRGLGFHDKLKTMTTADNSLDVRERARTAVAQMEVVEAVREATSR